MNNLCVTKNKKASEMSVLSRDSKQSLFKDTRRCYLHNQKLPVTLLEKELF